MPLSSMGDLAQSYMLRRQNSEIKARLTNLTAELTSGRVSDPSARLNGDFRSIGAIERNLTMMDSYDLAASETALTADAMQNVFDQIKSSIDSLGSSLSVAGTSDNPDTIEIAGGEAESWVRHSVALLNSTLNGRSLFAGNTTDAAALADADTILTEVKNAVTLAAPTTAADVLAAVDTWFDTPGGGFETLGYLGSTTPLGSVRVADGETIALTTTAADPEIRSMLKALVSGALLADDTVLTGDAYERGELASATAERLFSAHAQMSMLSADLGFTQSRLETVRTENISTRNMLELARADMLEVDGYDAATEIQAVEAQLEMLYTLTSRLSRLSLANYLS